MSAINASLRPLTSLALAIAALVSCGRAPETRKAEAEPPIAVKTARAAIEAVPSRTEVDGTVVGAIESVVSSRLSGTLASVPIAAGQTVRRGDILVRIEAREAEGSLEGSRAALAAARAARATATRNRERFETLANRKAAAEIELDRARLSESAAAAQEAAAEAAVRRAETDLSQAVLRAPFDAIVVGKLVEPGDLATPGRPLVRLASRTGRRVEAAVSEGDADRVALGALLRVGLSGRAVRGRVAEIVPSADPATRRRVIRIDLPEEAREGHSQPVPGTFARVLLEGPPSSRLAVPKAALVRRGGLELVWVVSKDGLAELRYVKAGAELEGDRVEILANISDGETVIVDPPATLESGRRVAPVVS